MSAKTLFAAAVIAGAVTGSNAQEKARCDKPTCQPDHEYKVQTVPHKDVVPFENLRRITNGKTYITDRQGNETSEDTPKFRGYIQASYVFTLLQKDFEAAAKKGRIDVTLDPVFKAAPDDKRACLSVPVKNVSVAVDENKKTATLDFTLDENISMSGQRYDILKEYDKNPKAEQVWCYSFKLGG